MKGPIKKGRKFNLQVVLRDQEGRTVRNTNPLGFVLSAQTGGEDWVGVPAMFRHQLCSELVQGEGVVCGVQGLGVTSHLPRGCVDLVVGLTGQHVEATGHYVRPEEVEPLLVPRLVIRSRDL